MPVKTKLYKLLGSPMPLCKNPLTDGFNYEHVSKNVNAYIDNWAQTVTKTQLLPPCDPMQIFAQCTDANDGLLWNYVCVRVCLCVPTVTPALKSCTDGTVMTFVN